MALKLEVEYDNYDDENETYTTLEETDVILTLEGHGILVPVSMFDGRHATYQLPEGATEDDLIQALEGCDWCYTGITEVAPEDGPGVS